MSHSGSVHTKFYSRYFFNTVYHLLVTNNTGEGELNFHLLERGGLISEMGWGGGGGGLNSGYTVEGPFRGQVKLKPHPYRFPLGVHQRESPNLPLENSLLRVG